MSLNAKHAPNLPETRNISISKDKSIECQMETNYDGVGGAICHESPPVSSGIQQRYVLIFLSFLAFFNLYAMRVNLSVALVAMVKDPHTHHGRRAYTGESVACLELMVNTSYENSSEEDFYESIGVEFDWDSNVQQLVLGSFYYGYFITQLPGGVLAEKYGAKRLFTFGMLTTCIFTLLTPLAANWSVWALIAARAMEGIGEGVTYPALACLFGRWTPVMERTITATLVNAGSTIGTAVSMVVSGKLCDSVYFGGWPSAFYVFGTLGCFGCILWVMLVYESPEVHPHISKSELTMIRNSLGERKCGIPTPWRAILTSIPLWGLVVTHFGQNWSFYTLLNETPQYLSHVLHYNVEENGLFSALPNFLQLVVAIVASLAADKIRARGCIQITLLRKIFNSIALYVPALCMLLVAFAGCRPDLINMLFSISMGINGCVYCGLMVTYFDISPEFAGITLGISNTIANLPGFLAPSFVGYIIESGNTLENWRIVYLMSALILTVSATVYNIFCQADLQPWSPNYQQPDEKPHTEQPKLKILQSVTDA